MDFTEEQIERYSRHIILKDVGGTGQQKIRSSKILVIGVGGLGSPAALYLAAAGVGTLGIVDGDIVDLSNLQRQVIHSTPDVGRKKTESGKEKLIKLNPDVEVITYEKRVFADNIAETIEDYDFIIDGTDNFPAKFLINDACVLHKKSFSHAGILRFFGQTITYVPGNACFRCLFEAPPPEGSVPSCSEAGVLGVVAGILGVIQAAEALKFVLGTGDLLLNRLLCVDVAEMDFRKVEIQKNPNCPVCGDNPTITRLEDYEQQTCDLKNKSLKEYIK